MFVMFKKLCRPKASTVLTCYLKQCKEPPWTSYFVKYSSVEDDQFGRSHFNWRVNESNYHILRTGCYPYIKYHCTKRPYQDLSTEDNLYRVIKAVNLGKFAIETASLIINNTHIILRIMSNRYRKMDSVISVLLKDFPLPKIYRHKEIKKSLRRCVIFQFQDLCFDSMCEMII